MFKWLRNLFSNPTVELFDLKYENEEWLAELYIGDEIRYAWSELGIVWRFTDTGKWCSFETCSWLETQVKLKEREIRLETLKRNQ